MIVVDTSSLIALATADCLHLVLEEYDIHTTEIVLQELTETAEYDAHGEAARSVLDQEGRLTVHPTDERAFPSARIDSGEGSCAGLTRDLDAGFLITDDLRALPELQAVADAEVATSPILPRALVQRDALGRDEALDKLDQMAEDRDWLGAPIYRRARQLFYEPD